MSFASDGPPAQLSMSASSADTNSGSEWATGLMMGVGDAQAEDGPPDQLTMWPNPTDNTDGVWIAGTDLGQPVSARPFSTCVPSFLPSQFTILPSVASPQGTVWHAAAFDGWWCGWFLPGIFFMGQMPWICIKRTATGPDEYVTVGFFGIGPQTCFPVCYLCPDKHTRSQPGSNVFTKTGGCIGNGEGTDMTESATVYYCVLVLRASRYAFTDDSYIRRGAHVWACAACAESAVARPQASSSR